MKCSAIVSFCVLATAASAAPSFSSQYELDGPKALKNSRRGNSIIDRLREMKQFSRFVEVIEKERGLRDELEGGKQTTLFAPTNDAFKQLEKEWGSSSSSSDERGRPEWKDIVRYHIAPDSEITSDCLHAGALIPTGLRLKSLDDRHQRMRVFKFQDQVWLNMQAAIVEKDIEADNGRIHAISRVVMPPRNVPQMLYTMPTSFSTFSAALERTGLCGDVATEKGVTVFAPHNDAWSHLGLENLKYLFSCAGQRTDEDDDSDRDSRRDDKKRGGKGPWCQGTKDLRKIVEHHVATKLGYSTDFMEKKNMKLKTLGHDQLTVCAKKRNEKGGYDEQDGYSRDEDEDRHRDVRQYGFVLNNGEARVRFTDGLACNGAIQVVDNVMIPSGIRLPHDRM